MRKHTPGPWTFSPGPHGSYDIDSLVSTGIKGDPCGESVGSAYREGDAHLIAAAPELLVELRAVSAWLTRLAIAPPNQMIGAALSEGVRRIDKAIDKAEGR